jgi:hypothetical protein
LVLPHIIAVDCYAVFATVANCISTMSLHHGNTGRRDGPRRPTTALTP